LIVDSGAHRAFAGHYWDAYEARTYISATNLGPMGWAIAAAAGVQCAQPRRRVAVITGDGCMQMNGIEVSTAARYKLPIIFVVMNNAALGNVWLRAHTIGPVPDELTKLPDHDWAAFAKALGCRGETVHEPGDLAGAFERALAGTRAMPHRCKDRQGLCNACEGLGSGLRRLFLPRVNGSIHEPIAVRSFKTFAHRPCSLQRHG
jgi:acetolactate synthase I/II/III large subunit